MSSDAQLGRTRLRILVIDDNQDAADSLSMLLRLSGYDVRTLYHGEHAIGVARGFKPDCVLSDIGMPHIDGYRLASAFRQDDELKNISLVAISGSYDSDRAKAAGFDHDFKKPVHPEKLLNLLTRILCTDQQAK